MLCTATAGTACGASFASYVVPTSPTARPVASAPTSVRWDTTRARLASAVTLDGIGATGGGSGAAAPAAGRQSASSAGCGKGAGDGRGRVGGG